MIWQCPEIIRVVSTGANLVGPEWWTGRLSRVANDAMADLLELNLVDPNHNMSVLIFPAPSHLHAPAFRQRSCCHTRKVSPGSVHGRPTFAQETMWLTVFLSDLEPRRQVGVEVVLAVKG